MGTRPLPLIRMLRSAPPEWFGPIVAAASTYRAPTMRALIPSKRWPIDEPGSVAPEAIDVLGLKEATIHPSPEAVAHGWRAAWGDGVLTGAYRGDYGRGESGCPLS